ncbi:MAG: PEGA domain-containing protein [Persicimonas sp.]
MIGFQSDGGEEETRESLIESLEGAADDATGWEVIGFEQTGEQLDAMLVDCFNRDCLTRIGEKVDAPAAVSVDMKVDADIYEWTISLWDLRSGEEVDSVEGGCELCGSAELEQTFTDDSEKLFTQSNFPDEPSGDQPRAGDDDADAKLHVVVEPEDAEIYVDDERVGTGEYSETVEPGTYEVRLRHDDYSGIKETVVVSEETRGPVVFRAHMSERDPAPVRAAPPEGAIDRLGDQRMGYGWLSTGVGAVLLGTGIYLTGLDGEPACGPDVPFEECDQIYATGGAGTTLGIFGSALLTGGITLLTWDFLAGDATEGVGEGSDDKEAASISISPSVGDDGGGLLLRGRF